MDLDKKIEKLDNSVDQTRRSLLKASYVAPAIITLTAIPSFASAGSSRGGGEGGGFSEPRYSRLYRFLQYLKQKYGW